MTTPLFSIAFGVGTQNRQGNWLEVFYAQPLLHPAGRTGRGRLPADRLPGRQPGNGHHQEPGL